MAPSCSSARRSWLKRRRKRARNEPSPASGTPSSSAEPSAGTRRSTLTCSWAPSARSISARPPRSSRSTHGGAASRSRSVGRLSRERLRAVTRTSRAERPCERTCRAQLSGVGSDPRRSASAWALVSTPSCDSRLLRQRAVSWSGGELTSDIITPHSSAEAICWNMPGAAMSSA
jgi:hypothetical protein